MGFVKIKKLEYLRNRRAKVNELEEKLQNCTKKCDKDPSRQNVEVLLFVPVQLGMKKVKK